ncbi:hypothetical protein IWQ60_008470 [Tieghemiomyces parasiticus]|uniref:Ras-domain-containing protein n=1 Tax=Tieghemiomyces parasiticus TaxID=78921 RepID=A0A9W7ZWE0_9FUNG|nr:hypothetical protein IWQ60_008470 [Tieghemiomyces parasiticus]
MPAHFLEAKVVILGSQSVGKTSLVIRYVQKTFSPNCPSTIGASFMATKLLVDGYKIRLQIWDTAGQDRFRPMAPMYYRGATAAILVYDITSAKSFEEIDSWIKVLQIVGNKCDLEHLREVSTEEAEAYGKKQLGPDHTLFEVSAKDDEDVDEMFTHITRRILNKAQEIERRKRNNPNGTVQLDAEHDKAPITGRSCC